MFPRPTDKDTRLEILRFLYENDGIYTTLTADGKYSQPAYFRLLEDLVDSTNIDSISPKNLILTLEHMRSLGLIGYNPDVDVYLDEDENKTKYRADREEEYASIWITPRGFDLIHEYELKERQQELLETQNQSSQILAAFTVILGVAALVQAAAAVLTTPQPVNWILGTVYAAILGGLLFTRDKWIPSLD